MGGHGAQRPLASASGSRARGLWLGTVLDVPATGTPFPHQNPQRQVTHSCRLRCYTRDSEGMQAGGPEMGPKPAATQGPPEGSVLYESL